MTWMESLRYIFYILLISWRGKKDHGQIVIVKENPKNKSSSRGSFYC